MSVFRRRVVFRDNRETSLLGSLILVTATAAGTLVFGGTASGNTSVTNGSATGTIVFAGAPVSQINIEVSGTGQVVLAGSATGIQRNFGAATGTVVFAGSSRCDAIGSGAIVFAGSATVGQIFTMDATGSIVFSGTGQAQHGTSATGPVVFAGTVSAPVVSGGTVSSAATGSIIFSGAAAGVYGSTNNVPSRFFIDTKFNVEPSTLIVSDAFTLQGNTQPASLSITNGEYSIDGANFSSVAILVSAGSQIVVRHTSASTFETRTTTTLVIGGVTGTFVSMTERDPSERHTRHRHRIYGHRHRTR